MLSRDGFEPFFRREFPRLVLFLMKNGAGEADAQDAAQEAMTQAYRAWARIENPRAWVWTAAPKICWKNVRVDAELDEASPLGVRDDPDSVVVKEEQWRIVRLFRALPAAQREVISLWYDGFGCREIALMVGKPASTVRSHLRHARTRLEEVIRSEGTPAPGPGM